MNEEDKTDLMDYLPDYLKEYHEFREIMGTESIELQNIGERHQQVIDDRFLSTCGIYGISRFEKMLGIMPEADDSLESRRFRILSKWNNAVPYNYAFLEQKLELLCGGDGYTMHLDLEKQTLEVKVGLASKNMLDAVKEMLRASVPCNILMDISLMYNQHMLLGNFTHKQLAAYSHKQLREEVVL